MSVNNWTIMKKLNLLIILALASALCGFIIYVNGWTYFDPFERTIVGVAMASFVVFLWLLIYWLRNNARFIKKLNEEIHALEGGDLNREIPSYSGNSEMAMLAESIDDFRKSMKAQLDTIAELEKSNRLMTEEIAHDLRTPLTSLMMYLDFALSELGDREPQAAEYVTKAKGRSVRLKSLLDENFNTVTVQDETETEKQRANAHEILRENLRDLMSYLEGEGFRVRLDVDVFYGQISFLIQREALGRVFTNLASNIMKYADKNEEVLICEREEETHLEVRIVNRVRAFEGDKPAGMGFGARIVKRMMEEMGGQYYAEEEDGKYTVVLRFAKA